MDFRVCQENAQRSTRVFLVCYAAAIASIAVVIQLLAAFLLCLVLSSHRSGTGLGPVLSWLAGPDGADAPFVLCFFNLRLFALVALGTFLVVADLARRQSRRFAEGGLAVVRRTRARPLADADLADPDLRRYRNVVAEMALAANVPEPAVCFAAGDFSINAFAAGHDPADAALVVTEGAVRVLDRDELQALVAHEFSHILNGDMALNMRLAAWLYGLTALSEAGRFLLVDSFDGDGHAIGTSLLLRPNRASGALVLWAGSLVLLAGGSLGAAFARRIRDAISRHRELLADASAVQFTRNPEALVRLLLLVGEFSPSGNWGLGGPGGESIAHMMFSREAGGSHPSIRARLAPWASDASRHSVLMSLGPRIARERGVRRARFEVWEQKLNASVRASAARRAAAVPAAPLLAAATAGALTWMEPEARAALRADPVAARACLFAALLDPSDAAVRARQVARIAAHDSAAAARLDAWSARLRPLDCRRRRLACFVALDGLGRLPPADREATRSLLRALAEEDRTIVSFELALLCMARQRFAPSPSAPVSHPAKLAREAALVMAELARSAGARPDAVAPAVAAARGRLSLFGPLPPAPPDAGFDAFLRALDALAALPPLAKQEFMNACASLFAQDGALSEDDENYLFAVAAALGAYGWRIRPQTTGL